MKANVRRCRACGCTDADCRQCIQRTGRPCTWVEEDLCSACQERGFNTLIRVKRGNDNFATVRLGAKTFRASSTACGEWAAERVMEKAARAVHARAWRMERYHTLSMNAARAALFLEF